MLASESLSLRPLDASGPEPDSDSDSDSEAQAASLSEAGRRQPHSEPGLLAASQTRTRRHERHQTAAWALSWAE